MNTLYLCMYISICIYMVFGKYVPIYVPIYVGIYVPIYVSTGCLENIPDSKVRKMRTEFYS